jgi:hypothetical protein
MSIGSISSTAAAQAPDNGAKVQLEREQRKVGTDIRDHQAADADRTATAAEEETVVQGSRGGTVDMYL